MRRLALAAALLVAGPAFAQPVDGPPADWHLRDADVDGVVGIRLDAAYAALPDRQPAEVVVAIIDSGVDIEHPDLAPVLWTNADEIAGNGLDDDGNGYVDDVHGWSFLGGPDGRNVEHDTYELARLVALCRAGTPDVTYDDCEALEAELEAERQPLAQQAVQLAPVLAAAEAAHARLTEKYGEGYALDQLDASDDPGPSSSSPSRAPRSVTSGPTSSRSRAASSTASTPTTTPATSSATTTAT